VISVSNDSNNFNLFCRSLNRSDFQDFSKDLNQDAIQELTALDVIKDKYTPSNLECYVGTANGKLAFINA